MGWLARRATKTALAVRKISGWTGETYLWRCSGESIPFSHDGRVTTSDLESCIASCLVLSTAMMAEAIATVQAQSTILLIG